jgi:hypothetical protein
MRLGAVTIADSGAVLAGERTHLRGWLVENQPARSVGPGTSASPWMGPADPRLPGALRRAALMRPERPSVAPPNPRQARA